MHIYYETVTKMGETKLTKTLKMAGMLFLKNNLCDVIAPEVKVWPRRNLLEPNPQDRHRIIDLCGIGSKYVPAKNPESKWATMDKISVLRGIEIKQSRGDFKNGFIHSGCNYHYLLFPKGLIKKSEVATQIGLIEFDPELFSVKKVGMKYWFKGFKVIRAPRFQELSERDFNYAAGQMAWCATNQMLRWAKEQLA